MKENKFQQIQAYIYNLLHEEHTGHDYYHIERVVQNAKLICAQESEADAYLVELAAWVHDIGDYKLNNGIDQSAEQIQALLEQFDIAPAVIEKIITIVSEVSFSKSKTPTSLEAQIVQDADRLDAIGAVGIARCFAYGGSSGNILFNPNNQEKNASSVQHFYDKLFKLKDLMHTPTAKNIAEERHQFMELYINQFYKEVGFER